MIQVGKQENATTVKVGDRLISNWQESKEEKRARIISLWIVHVQVLIFSLSFSIVFTGLYPYMQELLPNESVQALEFKYGVIVSANPLGQVIFAPILGYISQKFGSLRSVGMGSSIMFIMGNSLYALVSLIPEGNIRFYALVASRFITGATTGNIAPFRAYVASATLIHERTTHLAIASAFQSLGMTLGPGIQAALSPLQCSVPAEHGSYFSFDMFSSAGWISALTGVVSFVLFLPGIFRPFNVVYEDEAKGTVQKAVGRSKKPDYTVAWICICFFYFYFFNFVVLETVGTPICMDQFGWTNEEVVLKFGLIMSINGMIAFVTFMSVGPLARRFDERKLLLILGIATSLVGRAIFFPFPGQPLPLMSNQTDLVSNYRISLVDRVKCASVSREPGCSLDWCEYIPALNVVQFIVGMLILSAGHPFRITLTQSIFSKLLGPIPQGTWMGILSASGSFARVSGPIFVSFIYTKYGTYWTMASSLFALLLSLLLLLLFYPRFIPYSKGTKATFNNNGRYTRTRKHCHQQSACAHPTNCSDSTDAGDMEEKVSIELTDTGLNEHEKCTKL